jgi:hypothetical protein
MGKPDATGVTDGIAGSVLASDISCVSDITLPFVFLTI